MSCGPKTFVGMAEVKLSPYWSLYALQRRLRSASAHAVKQRGRCGPVLDVDEPLCVRVAEVAFVREPEVDLGLVERVLDFVRVHTGREAGDDLLHLELVRGVEDVIVDEDVVAQEVELGRFVRKTRRAAAGDMRSPSFSC